MSKKIPKNVPPAKTETSPGDEEQPQFQLPLNAEDLKKLQALGVNKEKIQKLVNWMASIEARFEVLSAHVEGISNEGIAEELKKKMQAEAAKMRTPSASIGGQGSSKGSGGQLDPSFLKFIFGGGGDDSIYKELAIDSMKANINLAKAITNAVVARAASSTVKDAIP